MEKSNMNEVDNKKASVAANMDKARVKNLKSTSQTSQECPNYTPQAPPSKDIGTMYYDCKYLWIVDIIDQ